MFKKLLLGLKNIRKQQILKKSSITNRIKNDASLNNTYNETNRNNQICLKKGFIKIYKDKSNKSSNHKIKNIKYDFKSKIIMLYIIFMIFQNYFSKQIKLSKINLSSEITITIKGSGNQSILSDYSDTINGLYCKFDIIPNELYVNGTKLNYTSKIVNNLEGEINNITMTFNSEINNSYVMFYELSNIILIDLSKFNSSKIIDMRAMFYGCSSLTSIDFTNFVTPLANNMIKMFYGCRALTKLDLSSFNTESVSSFQSMFNGCSSLKSLNLTNFITTSVKDMENMFEACNSLESLDLKSFSTIYVTSPYKMFYNCYALISLNLSHFDTSSMRNLRIMFVGFNSLKVLDINNFNTSSVNNMECMFLNCYSLTN